jgi:hypothetical protein
MDKNENGVADKKEAYISYGIAGIGLIMAISAFYMYQEFGLAKDFFYASVLLSGVRDGIDGLKKFVK